MLPWRALCRKDFSVLKWEEAFFSDAVSVVALGLAVNERALLSALVLYWLSLLD